VQAKTKISLLSPGDIKIVGNNVKIIGSDVKDSNNPGTVTIGGTNINLAATSELNILSNSVDAINNISLNYEGIKLYSDVGIDFTASSVKYWFKDITGEKAYYSIPTTPGESITYNTNATYEHRIIVIENVTPG